MTGEKRRAPEHRGETERWTLDAPRKGKKDAPRLCFAGENCRTIELNGDVFEHVEVVPSAALDAERERAQNFETVWKDAVLLAEEAQKEVERLRIAVGKLEQDAKMAETYADRADEKLEAAEAKIAAMREGKC